MTRFDPVRQRREMHRRIRAVVAERRMANRIAPITDDDEEPTIELRPIDKSVPCAGTA